MKYPYIKSVHEPDHPVLEITWSEGAEPRRYCGGSWCVGECGLPALVIGGLKAYADVVACGSMMQTWRVEWHGATEAVPAEHIDALLRVVWF